MALSLKNAAFVEISVKNRESNDWLSQRISSFGCREGSSAGYWIVLIIPMVLKLK
jgi:hypothetical protein